MTRWHRIRHNKQCRVPANIVCFDTEAKETVLASEYGLRYFSWRLGVASYTYLKDGAPRRTTTKNFTDRDDLWLWIASHAKTRGRLWVFAHNLAFDATISNLWEMIERGVFKLERYVIEDPPTIIHLDYNGRKIVCIDSMNYYQASLKSIGESIGTTKLPLPHQSESDEEWFRYCRVDVEILRKFMLRYIWNVWQCDLGNYSPTIAGQAMQGFRHRFMHHEIRCYEDPEIRERERAAYRGGRVMVGYVGKAEGPIYHLDVNNLYAYVMSRHCYPVKLVGKVDLDRLRFLLFSTDCYAGMAFAHVRTKEHEYAVNTEKGYRYCRGDYWTHLCGPELTRAILAGELIGIEYAYLYYCEPIFDKWCEYWLAQIRKAKESGDRAAVAIIKLMSNALYGKFGQRQKKWIKADVEDPPTDYGQWTLHNRQTNEINYFRSIAAVTQENIEKVDGDDTCPIISAIVTAHGRCYMDELRSLAGERTVYYQDTDSLICSKQGYDSLSDLGLLDQVEAGKLKVVSVYKSAEFFGFKRYKVDGELIASGLRANSRPAGDNTYMQETWQGAKTILSRNPLGRVYVHNREIRLDSLDPGGKPGSDGWVTPTTLGQE